MITAKQQNLINLIGWDTWTEDDVRRAHKLAINYGAKTNFLSWLRDCYKAKIERANRHIPYLGD